MDSNNSSVRTVDKVNEILELAMLNETDLNNTSQVIYFQSENLSVNNFKLLQLDKHLMDTLKEGKCLRIQGCDDDAAVLCTETQTYDLLEAETTNSLLLVKGLQFNNNLPKDSERNLVKVEISRMFYSYLEPVLSKPRLKKLNELLNKTVYKGPEQEFAVDNEMLLTYEYLETTIQISQNELKSALNNMPIVILDGKVRLLHLEYHFRVLSYMLKLIEENSWGLDEINFTETMNSLCDLVPLEVLNCLFDKYTEPTDVIDGVQLYKYKEVEVCKFFARVLLSNAGKFDLNEFMGVWKESVPEGMAIEEAMLHGIAVINRKSNPPQIQYFPKECIPENITECFKVLFNTQEKWTITEITPYLQTLTSDKMDVYALLAKHTRTSTIQGIKYYSTKYIK